jgi:hypothetical protein
MRRVKFSDKGWFCRLKAFLFPKNSMYSPTLAIRYIEEHDTARAVEDVVGKDIKMP